MNNSTGAHRRWRRRASTVISLGIVMVVAVAAPALAHPTFPTGAGFANTMGSNASPYPLGSRPILNMFLPFEQDGVFFKGALNTTVEVKVTIPAGWTDPACGAASIAVDPSHSGTVVPGWSCVIETANAHQVLHWHGPQISASQDYIDSAQFFTFQVTVPSPATQTSYGAKGSPAEGFYVEQVYASIVDFSLWRSPNDTTHPTAIVANGLVRTVAGTTAPPPNQTPEPEPTEAHVGPNKPKPAPTSTSPPGGANSAGAKPTGAPSPSQGDGRSTPAAAGGPSPSGAPTTGELPGGTASGSPEPMSEQPTPGADSPPSSAAEPLAQQRDNATGHGLGWQVLVGIVVGAAFVVGAVIAVVRRRRSS